MPSIFDDLTIEQTIINAETKKQEKVRVAKSNINLSAIHTKWKDKNIYEIYGINSSSIKRFSVLSENVIKRIKAEYKILAKIFHPDKAPQNSPLRAEHESLFKLFSEAYNTLIDHDKKTEYDLDHLDIKFQTERSPEAASPFSTPFTTFNTPPSSAPGGFRQDPFASSNSSSSSSQFNYGVPPFGSSYAGYRSESSYGYGYSQQKPPEQPPKPLDPNYARWKNFINSCKTEAEINTFINDHIAEINSLFKKELNDSTDNKYNPFRVAIEAEATLHVRCLILAGAKYNLDKYNLRSKESLALRIAVSSMQMKLSFNNNEWINILLADEQLLTNCNYDFIVSLLKSPDVTQSENLKKIISKIKRDNIEHVFHHLVIHGHAEGLKIFFSAYPSILYNELKTFTIDDGMVCYHLANIKSYESVYSTIRLLTHYGCILNKRSTTRGSAPTIQSINGKNILLLRALLNCGVLLENETIETVIKQHRSLQPSGNLVMDYLAKLPTAYLNLQQFMQFIITMLKTAPGNNELELTEIYREIQSYFYDFQLDVNTFHPVMANRIIDKILSVLKNQLRSDEKAPDLFPSCVNRAILLRKIIKLIPFYALAYGFENDLKVVAIVYQGAKLILQQRINSGRIQHGDYFVCYHGEGNYCIAYYDQGIIKSFALYSNNINQIEYLPLKNILSVTTQELFELRTTDNETILHINAMSQPANGENIPVKLLLKFPEKVKVIINNTTSEDNMTAMHYLARHHMNEALCKNLIDLGARIDIESKNQFGSAKVCDYKTSYIPALVALANEYDIEHQQEKMEFELQQKRSAILKKFEQDYRNKANNLTLVGRVNLAILNRQKISDTDINNANETTFICAILAENYALLENLYHRSAIFLDSNAFIVALLTNHQSIIDLMLRNYPLNKYPENIVQVLGLCSPETRKKVAIVHDAAKHLLLAEARNDAKTAGELLSNALKTQVGALENEETSATRQPMDTTDSQMVPQRMQP